MNQLSCEEICNLYKSELVHLFPLREIDNFIKIAFSKLNGWNKIDVSLNKSVFLNSELTKAHFELIERLKKNEPIQYILKETVFYELLIQVREGVLIPRCETEELVHWILKSTKQNDNILDIGTGSGCISLALKHKAKLANVTGIDKSGIALAVAKENAQKLNLDVSFVKHDILKSNFGKSKWNIIVSNPPYIPTSDKVQMHDNVLDYEPQEALFVSNNDPLIFYKSIAKYALSHLFPGGLLFFEIHEKMGSEILELLASLGFKDLSIKKDLQSKDRMIKARLI